MKHSHRFLWVLLRRCWGNWKSAYIESVRTSIKSPWQNGVAKRWVGNCRRELLDHVIILNEKHLIGLLDEYVVYYNEGHNHYSLDKDPPESRPVLKRESNDGNVIALPRIGGLHNKDVWQKAALSFFTLFMSCIESGKRVFNYQFSRHI